MAQGVGRGTGGRVCPFGAMLRARAGAYCAAPGRRAAKLRAALDARSPTFLRPGVHAPSRCAGDVECGREAWFIEGRAFFDTAAHSMRPRAVPSAIVDRGTGPPGTAKLECF